MFSSNWTTSETCLVERERGNHKEYPLNVLLLKPLVHFPPVMIPSLLGMDKNAAVECILTPKVIGAEIATEKRR